MLTVQEAEQPLPVQLVLTVQEAEQPLPVQLVLTVQESEQPLPVQRVYGSFRHSKKPLPRES